jgi:ribonuclease-3
VSAPPALQGLDALQARLEVQFVDHDMLLRSLAHRSWCAENGEPESNERLEFLGDSVLGLVVTHYVFEHFPSLRKGSSPRCARAL